MYALLLAYAAKKNSLLLEHEDTTYLSTEVLNTDIHERLNFNETGIKMAFTLFGLDEDF